MILRLVLSTIVMTGVLASRDTNVLTLSWEDNLREPTLLIALSLITTQASTITKLC